MKTQVKSLRNTLNLVQHATQLFWVVCFLFISAQSRANILDEPAIVVDSKIINVTVFMQGAQVHRKANLSIPKGTQTIVFDYVSPYINAQSIQASGMGKFTIMDAQNRYYYPNPQSIVNEIPSKIQRHTKLLIDSIAILQFDLQRTRDKKAAIISERNLILTHPLLTGKAKPDSLELLKGTVAFMQTQLNDLADRLMRMGVVEHNVLKTNAEMQRRLVELQNYQNTTAPKVVEAARQQVVLTVFAEASTSGSITINYAVSNAGWSPWYDITAKDAGDDIGLVYKAAVYQNTGEDWNNVRLKISNADPSRSNLKPMLPMWYIDYYQNQVRNRASEVKKALPYFKDKEVVEMDEYEDEALSSTPTVAGMASDYTHKMQNFTSIEFDIDLPYHIKSTGKTHFITLQKHVLKASFTHFIVPKLDLDAFVVAHVEDWEELNLLMGNANIYFGSTFVGRTVLDPSVLSDTLDFVMGRSRAIQVKRVLDKSDTKVPLLSGSKIYTATYTVDLRNSSANLAHIVLEDHIPLTRNAEIEIELSQSGGGTLSKQNGVVTWKFDLASYKKEKLTFTYTVKYPKEQRVSDLQ
jgi:uncharacterized protein (TIGR02231 family)